MTMETMEEIVNREIDEYVVETEPKFRKGLSEEMKRLSYLNNFYGRFPDDRFDGGGWVRQARWPEEWEIPFKEIFANDDYSKGLYSDFYLTKTPKEFYELIDSLIVECGFDLEETKELWLQEDEGVYELRRRALPVYIKMRELGFTHDDLSV